MSELDAVDGFLAPAPEYLAPFFPAYEIHYLIATGGMGAVYHALQISLDREVAIKILPTEFSNDESFCRSFEAEAKAMAKLNHPNLIGVFDFGEVNGMLFIVMEYVSGSSLHDATSGYSIEPKEVLRLIKHIALGLAHAHDHGILHRDIKPANILLDEHLQPKIGDFGLARAVDVKVQEGEVIYGTPGYTAPEVLIPPHHADQRADVFSLGVMLHELLTGKLPDADRRLPSVICQCDPRLDAVVRKATQANPDLRYQSAAQIAEEIEKIEKNENPSGRQQPQTRVGPSGRRIPSRPPVRVHTLARPKSGGSGFLGFLIVLLALGVGAYAFRDKWMPAAKAVNPRNVPQLPVDPTPAPDPEPESKPKRKPKPPKSENTEGSSNTAEKPAPKKPKPFVFKPHNSHQPESTDQPKDPEESTNSNESSTSKPEAPQVAKLDVAAFLKNARQVMIRKSAFDISRRGDALEKNMIEFRKEGKRLIRKSFSKDDKDGAEKDFDRYVSRQVQSGNRVGDDLSDEFLDRDGFPYFFEQFKKNEARIDEELTGALRDETQTYLQGLEAKVKKLREENDPVAADEIQDEIDSVKATPSYFVDMMVSGNK